MQIGDLSQSPGYDVTNEVLVAMRLGVDYRFPVTCRNFTVYLRPLTVNETIAVIASVKQQLKANADMSNSPAYESLLNAREFLVRASTPAPGDPNMGLTHKILGDLTSQEILLLFNEYNAIEQKVNPSIETMPLEKLKLLVDELKKSSREDLESIMTALSFLQLRDLASYLILND